MQLHTKSGERVKAQQVNSLWVFYDSRDDQTGFFIGIGNKREFKRIGLIEVEGDNDYPNRAELTIWPSVL